MPGRCAVCFVPATTGCSKCKRVYYCCQSHQELLWKTHKSLCKKDWDSFCQPSLSKEEEIVMEGIQAMYGSKSELLVEIISGTSTGEKGLAFKSAKYLEEEKLIEWTTEPDDNDIMGMAFLLYLSLKKENLLEGFHPHCALSYIRSAIVGVNPHRPGNKVFDAPSLHQSLNPFQLLASLEMSYVKNPRYFQNPSRQPPLYMPRFAPPGFINTSTTNRFLRQALSTYQLILFQVERTQQTALDHQTWLRLALDELRAIEKEDGMMDMGWVLGAMLERITGEIEHSIQELEKI